MERDIKKVENFWNNNLCGKHFINAQYPSKLFFEQYKNFRYAKEHHLNHLINWQSAQNKDVLEIGLGVGADGTRWAEYAASYTGVDLTEEAVAATKLHFEYLNLKGNIIRGNVESLPLSDRSFDIVYSHGVIHHTPSIAKALAEINRVMKPDGKVILMLYTKDSFNYWVRIQMYFRIMFLAYLLKYKFGFSLGKQWKLHIRNFQRRGWSYFSWANWYHHCTDGPDCEIANMYHKSEITELLNKAGFTVEKMVKAHFPLGGNTPGLERFLAKYLGFYQFIWASKS